MKNLAVQLCPPILLSGARALNRSLRSVAPAKKKTGDTQELDIYWDPKMAEVLETWGEGNAWSDIKLLMWGRQGRVLDIACGTGKVMQILGEFPGLELYGCDISDLLIGKARERGIAAYRLLVTDATKMTYAAGSFDHAYSIGSLEHFTAEGIVAFMRECQRVVSGPSFHMIPVSRSGKDEGWISPWQSYFNNSEGWWYEKCRQVYPKVEFLESSWNDRISVGRWIVCSR